MISLFFERILALCGWWGVALIACAVVGFLIQMWYWVGRYGRIPSYRNSAPGEGDTPGVSVAVVLDDVDYDFIESTLPVLFGQSHDKFEVVVVDLSGDVEFREALTSIAAHNKRLVTSRINRDPRFPISNKMALNVAVKAAHFENIILTTADSRPASDTWAARMARGFLHGGVVVGYCGLDAGRGLSGRLMRLGRLGQSVRWISAAMRRRPYRGTIQNVGFTRSLYFEHGGFDHLNMNIGEDDLFIQRLVTTADATVVVSAGSLVRQKAWGGLGWWYSQRSFLGNSFSYYPGRVKRYVGTELWSRAAFFAACAGLLAFSPVEVKIFAGGLLLLRGLVVLFECVRITRRLSEPGLIAMLPIYDVLSPLYESALWLSRTFKRTPGLWR